MPWHCARHLPQRTSYAVAVPPFLPAIRTYYSRRRHRRSASSAPTRATSRQFGDRARSQREHELPWGRIMATSVIVTLPLVLLGWPASGGSWPDSSLARHAAEPDLADVVAGMRARRHRERVSPVVPTPSRPHRAIPFRSWRMIGRAGTRRATILNPARAKVEA